MLFLGLARSVGTMGSFQVGRQQFGIGQSVPDDSPLGWDFTTNPKVPVVFGDYSSGFFKTMT